MSKKTIVIKSITINAPASRVWEIITTPGLIKDWLSEKEISVISEWKEGSPIIFHGKRIEIVGKGVILKLEPEKAFQYSYWTSISRMPDTAENHSIIGYHLEEDKWKTILTLTHENLIAETAWEHSNFYWMIALNEIRKMAEQNRV